MTAGYSVFVAWLPETHHNNDMTRFCCKCFIDTELYVQVDLQHRVRVDRDCLHVVRIWMAFDVPLCILSQSPRNIHLGLSWDQIWSRWNIYSTSLTAGRNGSTFIVLGTAISKSQRYRSRVCLVRFTLKISQYILMNYITENTQKCVQTGCVKMSRHFCLKVADLPCVQ